MSKLDFLTIAIVAVCIFALGFLVYKLINRNELANPAITNTTDVNTDDNAEDDGTYSFDDEGDITSDSTAINQPGTSGDLDDDELTTNDVYPEDEPATTQAEEMEDDSPSTDNTPSAYSSSGDYMVLAGSYAERINAEAQVKRLKNSGYSDASVELFNRGKLAVVLVDRFDSYSKANDLKKELIDKGIEAIVQKKRNQ
ncbi:MAG: hypothetical protein DHS20C18_52520 [Saprospiraceae bacterium]|nr:MAG: hypothetical protein DHS20C18_52520 [Saprospiraceae bacterium]